MIVGVGIDVVDVQRFADTLGRTPALRERLFTQTELACPMASLAARFAAKEALAKALGAPAGLQWTDAEIDSDDSGRPRLTMSGSVARRANEVGAAHVHVSLSHDAGLASAVVIVEN